VVVYAVVCVWNFAADRFHTWDVYLVTIAFALAMEPTESNINFGQVNILLAMFLVLDLSYRTGKLPQGVLTGIAAAVKLTFGQPCSGPCGLWAKTGTVSKADPVWAGTTLFTALVDTRVLQQWQGRVPVLLRNRRIALGVIVQPPPPTESISLPGHAASQLGMALVGELFNP
jgi:hypothetical protein